ncbi:MAG: hypothetical protein WB507_12245 [Solirubrobacterales bacterium]
MHHRPLIPILLALAALLGATAARGELTQSEGLQVAFGGGFSPSRLPRDRLAPVTVRMKGSIGTTDGSEPPQLEHVSFAINRHGKLFARGLPTCSAGLLQSTTNQAALARCRPALIGSGRFGAEVNLPSLPLVPVSGRLLAFIGRSEGRPEILVHFYVAEPAQVTLVLPFKVTSQERGDFGTVLTAQIPKIAGSLGYVTNLSITIGRRYWFQGRLRSLFSASCAAPAGFPGVLFNFARGNFYFANGQLLSTTLTRDCRVG